MTTLGARLACLLIGYLCGCLLTADLVSRHVAGKPAFELGVGNPGMANIGHELGTRWAAVTLVGDLGKVIVAVAASRLLFSELGPLAAAWAGLGATLGHNYPFWHGFGGGKGVATTCAAIVLASPAWGLLSCVLGFVAVVLSGYLCVGAIAIPTFFLLFCACFMHQPELTAIAAALLFLMDLKHGGPVRGIRTGATPRAAIADKVRTLLRRR